MTSEDKLRIEFSKLIGDFLGTLEGITHWEIPDKLKIKIEEKIKSLNDKYPS